MGVVDRCERGLSAVRRCSAARASGSTAVAIAVDVTSMTLLDGTPARPFIQRCVVTTGRKRPKVEAILGEDVTSMTDQAVVRLALLLAVVLAGGSAADAFGWKHHDNQEMVALLEAVHAKCPNVTRIYTLSETSVLGNPLVVLEFSDQPGVHELRKSLLPPSKRLAVWLSRYVVVVA